MRIGILIVRVLVLMAATAAGFALAHGLGLHAPNNFFLGGAGFLAGVLVVLLEWQARRIPVDRLFWGAVGAMLGVVLGLGLGTALDAIVPGAGALGRGLFARGSGYLGATVTLAKRDELEDMSVKLFPKTAVRQEGDKILDTSVIIDGRIVEVCQTGFLAGPLPVGGAFVAGALSGYGLMSSNVAGELVATHVTGGALPAYAPAFAPSRYDDPAYAALVETWGDSGQL